MMQVTAVRHHGFAQVPRLITRGTYKTLSLIEKGLYTCLKDICGDAGECFYTLRSLAKEINTSISTLSRYIPRLVKAGLIIAQKKIQAKNKHEVYHIQIETKLMRLLQLETKMLTLFQIATKIKRLFLTATKIVSI